MSDTDVKSIIKRIAAGEVFARQAFGRALEAMTAGPATPAQMAAFLVALHMRGETVAELAGAADALRRRMVRVAAPPGAVDIVGTGGDGRNTFNISTCTALVAAGAGLKVAKHGNRSATSAAGASDVLAALGVNLDVDPDVVARSIAEAGIGFMWAARHHPAMQTWAPVRREIGLRTLFNLVGPICNPAGVRRQVVGVFSPEWVEPMARLLAALGSQHAWVVHGRDGIDELTTTTTTAVAEVRQGRIERFDVAPEDAGVTRATLDDLTGGDAAANATALRAVLAGDRGPLRDIVLLNTAAVLLVGGRAVTLRDGVRQGAAAIDDGRARHALDRLVDVTNAR